MATSSKTITQIDFSGGMSATWDVSKTEQNQYRLGINCRARKNGIEGGYKPRKIASPNLIHQALVVADDKLVLIAGGQAYSVGESVTRLDGFPAMDSNVDVIHHQEIPAPTNFFVNDVYQSEVSTTPEAIVLQDGINTPRLLLSNLSAQLAGLYSEWSFANPRYIPVGLQMAYSGNKLFVVSVDGKKIYQSVSGRPFDFVLRIDNDGNKKGDADTTYLAVAAAKTKAIVGALDGGVIAFTAYKSYTLSPQDGVRTIFGEPYMRPADLFPVGALGQTAFAQANGETLFVSSRGINRFNEVLQTKRESNLTPYGAPIVDFLVRPIKRIACATLDDYTFFGLQTVFGDGVLVYDNQLRAFVGIDLIGAVKEFAVVQDNGTPRLYYITHTNELFEYNLFAGERMDYAVYFGEYNSGDALTVIRPASVDIAFSNVQSVGEATVSLFIDKKGVAPVSKPLTPAQVSERAFKTIPYSLPLEGNTDLVLNSFDFCNEPAGYSIGVFVHCTADTRLISMSLRADVTERIVSVVNPVAIEEETFLFFGSMKPDSVSIGEAAVEATVGKRYYFYEDNAGKIMNGEKEIRTDLPYHTLALNAAANVLYMASSGNLFDYETCEKILALAPQRPAFLLGDAGYQLNFGHARAVFAKNANPVFALAGDSDRVNNAHIADFSGKFGVPAYYVHETTYMRVFMCSFELTPNQAEIDANGDLLVTPDNMTSTGSYAQRIEQAILAGEDKVNIVCFHFPPYSTILSPGYKTLRWNFSRMGVHAVFSAAAFGYERTYVDGIHYINAGTANAADIVAGTGGVITPGAVVVSARKGLLSCEYKGIDGIARDQFTITR